MPTDKLLHHLVGIAKAAPPVTVVGMTLGGICNHLLDVFDPSGDHC